MKIAVSSYSFGKYISPDSLGFCEIMNEAKAMGFDAFEIAENEYTDDRAVVESIREHSEKIGLPIISFDVGADFTKNNCTSLESEIERVRSLVDTAAILGVGMMRHDVSYGDFTVDPVPSFDDVLPVISEGCRAVAEYAQGQGIMTMFENHGLFVQDSSRVEKLLNAVDHPNFGLLVDIGNFMCVDESPEEAVSALAEYAVHVHAKDFHYKSASCGCPGEGWFKTRGGNYLRGAIIGHGDACASKSLEILKNSGYDGYVTLEFEGLEDNLRGIKLGLDNLRKYVC